MGKQAWDHVKNPIDIVYLWVDGNDPLWIEKKNRALLKEGKPIHSYSLEDKRFTDHQELRYSLRSVIRYAPFFNHIYIVTMGQKPKWLMPHPRITIVDHKEIFKNEKHLPTFNSNAIESNLHRIPNLKEHFIYFNDDFFLGAPVTPFDFFTLDKEVVVQFSKVPLPKLKKGDHPFIRSLLNLNELFDRSYQVETRYELLHSPYALIKSYMYQTEKAYPEVFETTSSHPFRSVNGYPITNGFVQYHWLYQNRVIKKPLHHRYLNIANSSFHTRFLLYQIRFEKPHTFCLQDDLPQKNPKIDAMLSSNLNKLYPEPAPWEILD